MPEDKNNYNKKTPLSELGEFKLIDHITKNISIHNSSTIKGVGDDAAVIKYNNKSTLVSCDMLVENVHFDLIYCPLKHLGYKAAIVNFSDIYAMNGHPKQIVVGIALSNKFTVESVEEIYEGFIMACNKYGVDFVGGDTTTSPQGLIISVTVIGEAEEDKIVYRKGAKPYDLICVSGDLGAAYAGLLVLKREQQTFIANPNHQPDLNPYNYIVERQLKPEARKDTIEQLNKNKIIPTSMIDISDGLASELLHISKNSNVGFKIFEDKIPFDTQTLDTAEEFAITPLTFALNGGEDYELLFTADIKHHDLLKNMQNVHIIGHIVSDVNEKDLISNSGLAIDIKAQGWDSFN